jgi:probable phosphoglycerate mutase
VSTATRARETAEPVLAALEGRTRVEHHEWLHEIRMPAGWEGTPSEEVERAFAEQRRQPREVWWEGVAGGETFRDFHARVVTGLDDYLAGLGILRDEDRLWHVPADGPQRLLAIAHAGTNSVVLGHLLGREPEPWEWERFASDHASLTWLRTTAIAGRHIFSLQRFSDVEHLGDVPITA